MGFFTDILGTVRPSFRLGLTGVTLKNAAGVLAVRNAGDTADANVTAAKFNGFALPSGAGTPGQALVTDGAGNLSFASTASTASCDKIDTTSLAFGSTSPVAMFATGVGDIIDCVEVVIDTSFNAAPSLAIGVTGTTSKYMSATDVDLTAAAGTTFTVHPGLNAQGAESLIATYAAGGASAGAARMLVHFSTPQ